MIPKFRAWDTKKKAYTNYIIVDDMLKFMDKYTGVWFRDDNQDRFILMQSTGLFDKNGVEIFEGDIVEVSKGFTNIICYSVNEGNWKLRPVDKQWACSYFSNYENTAEWEIISNIYESPELLEVTDD